MDFNKMLSSYEELLKAFDKAKPVIVKEREKDKAEGKSTSWLVGDSPKFYVRILVEMEKLINETWEDTAGRKAMSKVNGKSLGSLRQKLRKYMRENVADDVAKFDPEEEDESGEEGEEKKPRASMDDGSDSDSDDWGDSDSDSDSDSDAGLGDGVTYTREMFLKKAEDPEKEAKKKEKKDAKDEKRELAKQKQKQKKDAK